MLRRLVSEQARHPVASAGRDRDACARLNRNRVDDEFALGFGRDFERNDLIRKRSVAGCLRRPGVRIESELVLHVARDAEVGVHFGLRLRHRHLRPRIDERVVAHEIDQRAVAEAVSEPRRKGRVRCVRHRLHTAGDHYVRVVVVDQTRAVNDRNHARSAHLIDRFEGDGLGQARVVRGLARRSLSRAALQHLAHDDVLDLGRIESRALERRANRFASEGRRGERRQRTAEAPEGRACGAQDDGFRVFHAMLSSVRNGRFSGWTAERVLPDRTNATLGLCACRAAPATGTCVQTIRSSSPQDSHSNWTVTWVIPKSSRKDVSIVRRIADASLIFLSGSRTWAERTWAPAPIVQTCKS